jgi:pilus biogenesis lipoprotein CpaD
MQHKTTFALLFLAAALPLAGCSGQEINSFPYATWKQSPPEATSQVTVKPVRFDVTFNGDDSAVDGANQTALNEFLVANRVNNGNTVDLAIGPVQAGEGAVVVKRVNAVEAELGRRGITVDSIRGMPDGQPGTVSILAKAVTVVPPACPGYNAPINMNTQNQPVIVTGCSTETNLDLMVSNPADLAGGRPLPPANAEAMALANQRYNEGKVPVLAAPVTTSQQ